MQDSAGKMHLQVYVTQSSIKCAPFLGKWGNFCVMLVHSLGVLCTTFMHNTFHAGEETCPAWAQPDTGNNYIAGP